MSKDFESAVETISEPAVASTARKRQAPAAQPAFFGDIIVNVRFLPNGLVNTITNAPEGMNAQQWFDHLCRAAPLTYKPLSGGRGTFVIAGDEFATIRGALA